MLFTVPSNASNGHKIDQFVSKFKETVRRKDLNSIYKMNDWEGLPDEQRDAIKNSFREIVENGILNVEIENIQNGEKLGFGTNGKVFAPNLPSGAKNLVEIPTKKKFRGGYSFYKGTKDDKLKFSHVVLKHASN